ncbi:MAG: hypothetical protein Q8O19_01205, partial [Rectinemataceae bacterium]|nr:hypothetical protein [Rectinemataceae bacterium]
VLILTVGPVLALSQSTNYKLRGGQINSLSGKSSSANYGLETGGQPISGNVSGLAYDAREGSSFSGRTATVAETTPTSTDSTPPIPPPEEQVVPVVTQLSVTNITGTQASVVFNTTVVTVTYIRYGQGSQLNLTTPTDEGFSISHQFLLSGLVPNSQYSLVVNMRTAPGVTAESIIYTFNTLLVVKIVPNASGFTAEASGTQINLSWTNPAMSDFGGVRLLRKLSSYPTGPNDGEILFTGLAQSYTDSNVAVGQTYYYTLFVYDTSFNYSSGAIASAIVVAPEEEIPPHEEEVVPPEEEIPPGEIIPAEPPELPEEVVPTGEPGSIASGAVNIL